MENEQEEEIVSLNIFLFSVIALVLLWIVWKSSEVRAIPTNLANINIGVRRSASLISQTSTASTSTVEDNINSSVEDIASDIFLEASQAYNSINGGASNSTFRNILEDSDDQLLTDEERIIRDMDRDLPTQSNSTARRRVSNLSTRESDTQPSPANESASEIQSTDDTKSQDDEEKISIKLKFLNDEIKIDNHAHLNETVLSFKRRNFKTELESKLIKLIFNGKLLEDDKKTLVQCGIFSEAVVHCLVMQKKPTVSTEPLINIPRPNIRRRANGFPLEWSGQIMIYVFGMALAMLTLMFTWFVRIQYEMYFSFYSTVGLVLITTLFIVLIPVCIMLFS